MRFQDFQAFPKMVPFVNPTHLSTRGFWGFCVPPKLKGPDSQTAHFRTPRFELQMPQPGLLHLIGIWDDGEIDEFPHVCYISWVSSFLSKERNS